MAGPISKDRLIWDAADAAVSDQLGAHLLGDSDTEISSTTQGGNERLDVDIYLDSASASSMGIYAEDSVHVSSDLGQFSLGVRSDAEAALAADGDYHPFLFDATGRLKTDAEISMVSGSDKNEDAAAVSGDVGTFVLATRSDSLPVNSGTDLDGDYTSLFTNNSGELYAAARLTINEADDDADAGNPLKVGSRGIDQSAPLTALSAGNDRADLLSDLYRRVFINESCSIGAASGAVTAGLIQVALPAANLAGRKRMIIQNLGTKDCYIGPTGVLTTTGIRLVRGGSVELNAGEALDLFIISAAAAQDIRVLECA